MNESLELLGAEAGWGDARDLTPYFTDAGRLSAALAELERAPGSTDDAVLVMHDVEGVPLATIAETYGLSSEETRAGLHRARLSLMGRLRSTADG